jgi:hypothetical protein
MSIANDGAFYARGNQLIPINDKDISLTKEILTINRLNSRQVIINVYYELMNSAGSKDVIVGFEAASPSGDVNGIPIDGEHPYMYHFTAQINDQILPYKVAIVKDSTYYKNGKFDEVSKTLISKENENEVSFFYVYYFKAHFIKGKNIVRHSYILNISNGIAYLSQVYYVLTTAKRWANKKIDDFTLEVNMGDFSDLKICNNFFDSYKDWTIVGIGKSMPAKEAVEGKTSSQFYLQQGSLYFHKNNFIPNGNIEILTVNQSANIAENEATLNFKLPFSDKNTIVTDEVKNPVAVKILRNLPYARRGYVFQSADLKAYYEKQDWYNPNPGYIPSTIDFTKEEKEFLKGLDK